VKAQERYQHETRLEGSWTEQGVKRLRKPEGAAQPGEANSVQVAVHLLKRWRAEKPQGRLSGISMDERLRAKEVEKTD